jgi:hypothetical protein
MPARAIGDGPYHLTPRALDSVVTRNCPGTFVLGHSTDTGFQVDFVGSAGTDVNARLQSHIGKYRHFHFDYLPSAQAAFAAECQLYHDYAPQDNTAHPLPPRGSFWGCPHCAAAERAR